MDDMALNGTPKTELYTLELDQTEEDWWEQVVAWQEETTDTLKAQYGEDNLGSCYIGSTEVENSSTRMYWIYAELLPEPEEV